MEFGLLSSDDLYGPTITRKYSFGFIILTLERVENWNCLAIDLYPRVILIPVAI